MDGNSKGYSRSGQPIRKLQRYLNWAVPIKFQLQGDEYRCGTTNIKGKVMCHIQHSFKNNNKFVLSNEHFSAKQGLIKFGARAKEAAQKEMD